MRIVYLHQYFKTPEHSGGTRSHAQATRLAARGHEVHMVTSDRTPGAKRRTESLDGITVHWLPVSYENDMTTPRRLLAFVAYAVLAARTSRRLRPDLVMASSTPLTVSLPAIFATAGRSAPIVLELRDLWPDVPVAMGALQNPVLRKLATCLERVSYRRADKIIALSEGIRSAAISRGVSPENAVLIPNACDFDIFADQDDQAENFRSTLPWLGRRPLIVYAGTFGRANGLAEFVATAGEALSLDPEVRFVMVGSGAEEQVLTAQAEAIGALNRNFFILPRRSKSAMAGVLSAADIATSYFLPLPVLTTTSPNKVFDALAAGTPVATSSGGWLAATLDATAAGLVLPREPHAAAHALCAAVRDKQWLLNASVAATQLAHDQFSRDDLFELFERTLLGAVGLHDGSPLNGVDRAATTPAGAAL